MTPGLFEHGLFVALVLVMPLWAVQQHRRLLANLAAGKAGVRVAAYLHTMAVEWVLALLVVARWAATGSLPGVLGAGDTGTVRWWIGTGVALAACAFLVVQMVVVVRSAARMAQARGQIEPLRAIIPASEREARVFHALAVTAGVCEEILYRAFMIAYLAAFGPMWFAVVGSSLVFGLGHAYQGASGVLKTGLVGLTMAALFLLTGSLWAPILVHAVIDLTSGHLGRKVLAATPPTSPAPAL